MPADHEDVVNAVVSALKDLSQEFGYTADDVRVVDFPFVQKPHRGLLVSALTETEGESLSESSDIGYPVQIVRCGHRLSPRDGLPSRSDWRWAVHNRFNRTRLGLECELMTRAEYDRIQLKEPWDGWNLDASTVKVTVWIRQPIYGK
jgi:hypothetical protein